MADLKDLREQIDSVDGKIIEMFDQRIAISRKIGNIKRLTGKDVYDPAREKEKIDKIYDRAGYESRAYVEELYMKMMELSKKHQSKPSFGVLGRSLPHTYSPEIHNILCPDYTYDVIEMEPEQLDKLYSCGVFKGFNVTIPYKKDACARSDVLDGAAEATGSVNTVVFGDDGKVCGYNTDCYGFMYMVKRSGIEIEGKEVLVLGTGGASASVKYALKELGAAKITECGRTSDINYDNVYEEAKGVSVIVNCTPVGTYPEVNNELLDLTRFAELKACLDLVYNPSRTKFIQQAQKLGVKTCSGLPMLVAQAYKASLLFRGDREAAMKIPEGKVKDIEDTLRVLDSRMRNITLIGMPGSGKTTLAKKIAKITGRTMVDLDYAYKDKFGMTSAEAIGSLGEDSFRDNESLVASEVLPRSGLVISCGGGIVTRPDNEFFVRCNSNVFYIERPLSCLSDHNRPVSIKHGVEALYEQRKDKYESWCDYKLYYDRYEDYDEYTSKAVGDILAILSKED
ncbi:MAG: chorismate mutase [Saccharofermentans sp.]|nr:chorismate mutase [Saccharofermentans sp.]